MPICVNEWFSTPLGQEETARLAQQALANRFAQRPPVADIRIPGAQGGAQSQREADHQIGQADQGHAQGAVKEQP